MSCIKLLRQRMIQNTPSRIFGEKTQKHYIRAAQESHDLPAAIAGHRVQ